MEPPLSLDLDDDLLSSIDEVLDSTSSNIDIMEIKLENEGQKILSSKSRISTELICVVCGAQAHGFNFDQITCESCKAFFRRNALKNFVNMKCRSNGSCIINEVTRRSCSYCRLKKCFNVKMRKDWIRTEEEKQIRSMIKENKTSDINGQSNPSLVIQKLSLVRRRKKRLNSANMNLLVKNQISLSIHQDLSNNDRVLIDNILSAYQKAKDLSSLSHLKRFNCSTTIIEFLNGESQMFKSLVIFLKGIQHFHQLDIRDQVLLIKRNLSTLIHLHHLLVSNFREDPILPFLTGQWINRQFAQNMSATRQRFDCFIEYPQILKLIFVVLIFSTSLCTPHVIDNETAFNNLRGILSIQNFYVEFLWKYLNFIFNDEKRTQRTISLIITQILRYQTSMNAFEDNLCISGRSSSTLDPLIESVFRLS